MTTFYLRVWLLCAHFDLLILILSGFDSLNRLFECSVLVLTLKHKVTVGKDTLNIKQAVCCSEVGPISGMANCKQEHRPNSITVDALSQVTRHLLV